METLEKQELEEQEAIMPEGYGEGDDYFQEEDWGKGDKVEADAEPAPTMISGFSRTGSVG